jgi:hypothetical protein
MKTLVNIVSATDRLIYLNPEFENGEQKKLKFIHKKRKRR